MDTTKYQRPNGEQTLADFLAFQRDAEREENKILRGEIERLRKALEWIASSPEDPLYPDAECGKLRQVARDALK